MTDTDKADDSKIPTIQTEFSRDRLGYIVKRKTVKGMCWHCGVYPLREVEHPWPQAFCQRCWLIQKSVGSTPLHKMVEWNKQYELEHPIEQKQTTETPVFQTATGISNANNL